MGGNQWGAGASWQPGARREWKDWGVRAKGTIMPEFFTGNNMDMDLSFKWKRSLFSRDLREQQQMKGAWPFSGEWTQGKQKAVKRMVAEICLSTFKPWLVNKQYLKLHSLTGEIWFRGGKICLQQPSPPQALRPCSHSSRQLGAPETLLAARGSSQGPGQEHVLLTWLLSCFLCCGDAFFSPWIPTCSCTWVSFLEAVLSLRLLRSRSRYQL